MYSFDAIQLGHYPIDIHSHFNHGSPFDSSENDIHLQSLEFLESVYKKYHISQVGFSTYASVLKSECVIEENEYLHQLAEKKDWIYQWVVIDPRQKETYLQAEVMLRHPKTLGIKIHPSLHGYNILEYADELFSFADKHRAVVLMHPQHIDKMPLLADQYPNMKLIIAHLGSKEHIDAIAASKYGNIYTDTSGGASSLNFIIEYAVQRVGAEKILFGTDTYSFAFQFGRIALSDISTEDKEKILWKNAVHLFSDVFEKTF